MSTLVENFVNGNLKEAKRQAAAMAHWEIRCLFEEAGYSLKQSVIIADWLKGRNCWKQVCEEI